MPQQYERLIGLKTIWLTIVRRFKVIFIIFIPIALASVMYTQLFMTKTYQSSVTYYCAGSFTAVKYPAIPSAVKSMETATQVEKNLAGADDHVVVRHANGNPITKEEIYSGITIASSISSTTGTISFTYQSTDKTVTKAILEEVATVALPEVVKTFAGTVISTHAGEGVKNSSENKYMLIGIAAGLVLACGFAFVDEIFSDEVYDKYDVMNLGSDGFEITVSK